MIEERLYGVEASYIAMCDGNVAVPLASSQDHKRAYDNDQGPNTGGMGAYSPAPHVDRKISDIIQREIVERTLAGMRREGCPLAGFLYVGVMISDGVPYVLEYNARMGDPECQPIVARMDFDLYEYMAAAASGRLGRMPPPRWRAEHAVCVVLAARGYPGTYAKGSPILVPETDHHTTIFHAGYLPAAAGNSSPTAVGCWASPLWEGHCAKLYRGHTVRPTPYPGATNTVGGT